MGAAASTRLVLQATASFDMTWRLWDVETGQTLLEQEGHSRAVYSVAFQSDGALAGSVGLDAIGKQSKPQLSEVDRSLMHVI